MFLPSVQSNNNDEANEAQKARMQVLVKPSSRIIAQVLSIVFHPLLLVVYVYWLLAWSDSFFFAKPSFWHVWYDAHDRSVFYLLAFMLVGLPALSMGMMYGLNMISSITLPSRQERIAPYILVGLTYIVAFMQLDQRTAAPPEVKSFVLGGGISVFMAFFANIFTKISAHAAGMGGLVATVLLMFLNMGQHADVTGRYAHNLYILPLVVIAAGLVGTSRLTLGAHDKQQIYLGYMVGFFAQFVATYFVF